MSVYTGIKNRFAIQKATTWGTVADAGTGDLLPVKSENLNSQTDRIPNNELNDTAMRSAGDAGRETVGGGFVRDLHYQGDHVPLALSFGTAGSPADAGGGYHTHTLVPAGTLEGIFASIFSDRENNTIEIDSAKITSVTIRGSEGGRLEVSYEVMGRDFDKDGNLSWGSVTEDSNAAGNFVLFAHGTFQFVATQGSAVDTAFYPDSFEVTFSGNFSRFWSAENTPNIDELIRDGFVDVTGSFTLPHDESNPWLGYALAQTALTMSWDFASGSYAFNIDFPYVVVTSPTSPTTDGPGRQPVNVSFVCEKATSNPTGMASTLPHIVNTNQDSANTLA
ncbi:MAG: phage tail tube protein [Solirubrobacterales bacterium]